MNRRRRMLSSNLCCRFETVPDCEKKETCKHEGIVKKKNFLTVLHQRGEAVRKSGSEKNAGKLRKIAENCEKLRKIAKNCEIAENCEKLRTSIPPPPCFGTCVWPRRQPRRRFGRRLEGVAKAVGGGYRRLQVPLGLALGVRGTVAGHRLGALESGGPQLVRCGPAT